MLRKLRVSDFKEHGPCYPIYALYNGNNKYLTPGEYYYVTFNQKSGMATVQLSCNPQMKRSNGGIQFPVGTFLVEEEEKPMAVNFDDLSSQDKERVLEQARLMLDEENIKKDAITAYKIKKKDFVEQCLDEIYKAYHMRYETDKNAIKTRFVSMTNYLLKVNLTGKQYAASSPNIVISTPEEWQKFVKINTAVKELIINCKEV